MKMEIQENKFNELREYLERSKPDIESSLREYLPLAPSHIETQFNEALEYALFPGGKRIRPILTLLGAELVGGEASEVLPASAAVEFIHTASLIFDDLPCMDNSSKRRAKPSLHEKFGEGLAVLVGLGLLNASYPLVFVNHTGSPEKAIQAHAEIVECVGASGMVGGQSVDLALVAGVGTGGETNYDFESIRNLKTSALLRLALRTGAILSGANYIELAGLSRISEMLGNAYQISDDLIDLNEDGEMFPGDGRGTTLAVGEGEEAARLKLESTVSEAKRLLVEDFDSSPSRTCLIQLADFLTERRQ